MGASGVTTRQARLDDRRDAAWWGKVDQGEGCWAWTGALSGGYGSFWNGEYTVLAHRYGYEMLREPIPEGLHIDHVCRNTACVKPVHLDVVSQADHALRRIVTTHCRRGHELTDENVYIYPKSGARLCTTCRPERTPTAYAQPRHTPWHAEAAALYVDGATQAEIATKFGVDASVVSRALRNLEVTTRPSEKEVDREAFERLVAAGVTRPGLARIFGVSTSTVTSRTREWLPAHRFPPGRPTAAQTAWEQSLVRDGA